MSVRHLLLDADGVLQHVGGDGWRAEIERRLGDRTDELVSAIDTLEAPALRGESEFPEGLDAVLEGFGVDLDAEELYVALWESITVDPQTLAIAVAAREGGVEVHLATNQHRRRAGLMRHSLGYDRVTDRSFYSCEVGAAKPEPQFFDRVLEALGRPEPDQVVLVDDSRRNVEAAAALGLRTVHWHHDHGHDALRSSLAEHGIRTDLRGTP